MSYPTSIDSIPEPTATSPTNSPSASGVSVAQTTAIVALENKLGTGASTPVASTLLRGTGTGTTAFAQANLTTDVTGTLPTANGGTGNTTGTATVNANLTGPITSSGNATSIASQTGTGSKFVVDTSPTLVTPNLGTPSAAVLTNATGLPYAGLLSTIFSGQVSSYTNTGSGGGTAYYINLGGIKLCWGISGTISATTGNTYAISLPSSFFTTVQLPLSQLYNPTNTLAGSAMNSYSTSAIQWYSAQTMTFNIFWFVIGT